MPLATLSRPVAPRPAPATPPIACEDIQWMVRYLAYDIESEWLPAFRDGNQISDAWVEAMLDHPLIDARRDEFLEWVNHENLVCRQEGCEPLLPRTPGGPLERRLAPRYAHRPTPDGAVHSVMIPHLVISRGVINVPKVGGI